jgi:hypothetical protein
MPLVMDLLGIPDDLVIYDMMALGHPAAQPKPRIVRDRAELAHYDRYDSAKRRTDGEVRDFLRSLRK